MNKKIPLKKCVMLILTVLLAMLFYIIYIDLILKIDVQGFNYEKMIQVLNWTGVGIVIFCCVTWIINTGQVFSPYTIFMVFFFLFNYGQCLMWAFNIHLDNEVGKNPIYYGHWTPTSQDIIKTQIFTCISMFFFHLGGLFCYKPRVLMDIKNKKSPKSLPLIYNSIFYTGVCLGVISIPVTLYRAYKFFSVSFNYGYKALYYSDHINQGGITMIIEMFFFPALICLLIGSRYKINIKYIVYFCFAIYAGLNLLSGDRGSWLYKLLILIWLENQYNKKITIKKFIYMSLLGVIGLNFLSVFMSYRNVGISNFDIRELANSLSFENSPITSFVFEMGGTMAVITTLLKVGSSIWQYSNSYLTAFVGLISTRVVPIFGLDFILIDNWFSQEYLGISWGAGFSMIAEAFLTGGMYFTPFIMMIIGFFISSILYVDKKLIPKDHPIRYFFVATSLHTWIGFSRGSSYLYLKTWFYGTIMVCIMFYIIKKILNEKM